LGFCCLLLPWSAAGELPGLAAPENENTQPEARSPVVLNDFLHSRECPRLVS
jgi:hypothetical protein